MSNMNKYASILVAAYLGFFTATASAIMTVNCSTDTAKNHMFLSDTEVSSCVASGVGNINGNTRTDDFLTSGGTAAGYVAAGSGNFVDFDKDNFGNSSGTWSITAAVDAIGFKFGTGNNPDEWFVFDLISGVTGGDWDFVNVFDRGGGLSHIQLYNKSTSIPEPSLIGLLAMGILGLAIARRRALKVS
ncbi:MAG: hypothetical protein ACJAZP_000257 [Psychromonas sp.]|jgi:hypothetical protein|uniref:PEP-CTERM sorting domain-containing protein n=1 Tax=Psychromonas sp. TaxID=1884585 RepID=UPI0039E63219